MSKLPRWAHRAYAKLFGYFWVPCPLCGRMYGGHEWRTINRLPAVDPDTGLGICPACTRAGRGTDPRLRR